MDRAFDRLFAFCGGLAAVFLVGICVIVLAQVIGRLMGVTIPSADEFAGYCLSASSFLALGYALRTDKHIRVTLLIDRLGPRARRATELFCLALGTGLSAFFAWYVAEMVYWSVTFDDVTQGIVVLPLWLPQSGMLIGSFVLAAAFLADLAQVLRGRDPSYIMVSRRAEEAREAASEDIRSARREV